MKFSDVLAGIMPMLGGVAGYEAGDFVGNKINKKKKKVGQDTGSGMDLMNLFGGGNSSGGFGGGNGFSFGG